MNTARFAVFSLVTLVVVLIALLIEQYRMCKEQGYSDCPRPGHSMWRKPVQEPPKFGQ